MAHHSESVHRGKTANGHFLLSKTPVHEPDPASRPAIVSAERLREHFPELLVQDEFLETALKKLYAVDHFGAMAIVIDDIHSLMDPNGAMIDLANALDSISRSDSGCWGLLDHDMLGCFFPEKIPADCQETVKALNAPSRVGYSTAW